MYVGNWPFEISSYICLFVRICVSGVRDNVARIIILCICTQRCVTEDALSSVCIFVITICHPIAYRIVVPIGFVELFLN